MDVDGISAVLGAIAASAGAGGADAIKDMTKDTITGGRDRLVELVRRRLKRDAVGDAKLTVYAAEPTPTNAQALHGHLGDAGIDQDIEIITLAREVLAAAGPAALAPGSVAANVIKQVNKDGGTGFIGGQHVHHHNAAPVPRVSWELFRLEGYGYELRNTGSAVASDTTVDANVKLTWTTSQERDIPGGSSIMFLCEPRLADPSPVITVTWKSIGVEGRQRWHRPLPRK